MPNWGCLGECALGRRGAGVLLLAPLAERNKNKQNRSQGPIYHRVRIQKPLVAVPAPGGHTPRRYSWSFPGLLGLTFMRGIGQDSSETRNNFDVLCALVGPQVHCGLNCELWCSSMRMWLSMALVFGTKGSCCGRLRWVSKWKWHGAHCKIE